MNKKVLLVLGASSDIGMELIRQSADQFDYILAHFCHLNDQLQNLKSSLGDRLYLLNADFSKLNETQDLISKIKEIGLLPTHILHLPSPKLSYTKYQKIEWEAFTEGLDTSLRSAVLITQAFLPVMAKNKFGRVVIMLSSCTLNTPPKYMASYVTVKYSLLGLINALSTEYADRGITINGISPDMIETKFLANIPELITQQNAMNAPKKRNLTITDVIPTIKFLLSDQSECITGQNIGITGGN